MREYSTIEVEQQDATVKIILNRPDAANAMNDLMNDEIIDVLSWLRNTPSAKFLVLTARGQHFSGGADMKELLGRVQAGSPDEQEVRNSQLFRQQFSRRFDELDQITIAAINGPMYGAGFTLAINCDFRIMSEAATACLPEIDRGIFFSGGATPRLVNLVGYAKAMELIMLCEPIDAQESLRIGLVNKICPPEDLESEEHNLVSRLDQKPFAPIRLAKKMVYAALPSAHASLMYEPELQNMILASPGIETWVGSFTQK
jgi:enoyl-CoA hydratase/carnithine racemase